MRKLNILALAAMFGFGFCVSAIAGDGTVRKIVVYKKGSQIDSKKLTAEGWEVGRKLKIINAVVITVPEQDSKKADRMAGTKDHGDVLIVENDFYTNWLKADAAATLSNTSVKLAESEIEIPVPDMNVAAYGADLDPEIPWGVAKVGAPLVWKKWTGKGVKVAVVDTGVDLKHPDLAPNIVKTYNVTNGGEGQDDQGHGTHVSGTIAAVRDGKGVVGVAPEASLYVAKVLGANGSGSLSDVVAGIDWAVQQGVAVMNMSLGSPYPSESLELAVKNAKEAGVTVVCAAGNDSGPVGYPAAYAGAIAISAGDENGGMASFSSHGPQVAFIAPGVNINSTYLGGGYKALRGTSMASPHVAGLAVLAVQGGAVGPDAVLKALKGAAKPTPGMESDNQGNGMINAGDITVKKMNKQLSAQ
ncbi:MAG: S8 family peptidase [Elusimicrobia bacterium]|nr:S8 family peptidase [Elusimicrobiota bacterium]